jgi:hypothetical protein
MKGKNPMKYLIIKDNKGFYTLDGVQKTPIDQINKEDLLSLLNTAIDKDDFEMDAFSPDILQNPAHRVIYKNLYQKFDDVVKNRVSFNDEKTNVYKDALNKYSEG